MYKFTGPEGTEFELDNNIPNKYIEISVDTNDTFTESSAEHGSGRGLFVTISTIPVADLIAFFCDLIEKKGIVWEHD